MSALRNYPVICGRKNVGLLQSVCLDTAQKRVSALIVACGLRGKKMILPQDVISLAKDFILVERVRKFRRGMEGEAGMFIRDTTGLLAGRAVDYAIDENDMTVKAIEMIAGYLPGERRRRIWVFSYERTEETQAELIVPACLGCEQIFFREGILPCESPQ